MGNGPWDTWIFDLDNTLYPAEADLFSQIDIRMKGYIARLLGLAPEEAFRIQKAYYHRYGTSLRGLMEEHHVDPEDFLAYVHDIDHSVLSPNAALNAALTRLPGRKIIFTNGSAVHAANVMRRLEIDHHFEAVHDITAAAYIPKPQQPPYDQLIADYGIDPRRSIMFEDSEKNLIPAAAMGMTTVWVKNDVHWSATEMDPDADRSHCHHTTDCLATWLTAWLEASGAAA